MAYSSLSTRMTPSYVQPITSIVFLIKLWIRHPLVHARDKTHPTCSLASCITSFPLPIHSPSALINHTAPCIGVIRLSPNRYVLHVVNRLSKHLNSLRSLARSTDTRSARSAQPKPRCSPPRPPLPVGPTEEHRTTP